MGKLFYPEEGWSTCPFSIHQYARLTCTWKTGIIQMIKTFADKETERIYRQEFSKKLPQSIQRVALRKLLMLDASESLEDLRVPPSNHLEPLHGDRKGQKEGVVMAEKIMTPKISEILWEEFMEPMGISAYKLAKETHVPVSRVQDILHDRRGVTADTSLRLGQYFGVSETYFLNLQNDIDIRNAKMQIGSELESIVPLQSA